MVDANLCVNDGLGSKVTIPIYLFLKVNDEVVDNFCKNDYRCSLLEVYGNPVCGKTTWSLIECLRLCKGKTLLIFDQLGSVALSPMRLSIIKDAKKDNLDTEVIIIEGVLSEEAIIDIIDKHRDTLLGGVFIDGIFLSYRNIKDVPFGNYMKKFKDNLNRLVENKDFFVLYTRNDNKREFHKNS
jgi:hypothetical protein